MNTVLETNVLEASDLIDLIGTPYVAGGRDASGCDCYGLLCLAFARAGIDLPDHKNIDAFSGFAARKMAEKSNVIWRKLGAGDRFQLLDVALMTQVNRPAALPNHVGFWLQQNTIMHADDGSTGACLARVTGAFVISRIAGWFRHVDLEALA